MTKIYIQREARYLQIIIFFHLRMLESQIENYEVISEYENKKMEYDENFEDDIKNFHVLD